MTQSVWQPAATTLPALRKRSSATPIHRDLARATQQLIRTSFELNLEYQRLRSISKARSARDRRKHGSSGRGLRRGLETGSARGAGGRALDPRPLGAGV